MAKNSKNLKLAQGPRTPKLAQGLRAPKLAQGPKTQAMASGDNQMPPSSLNKRVPPQDQGHPWPKSVGTRGGLNYSISNQVLKFTTHLKGGLQPFSLTIYDGNPKVIQAPQPLYFQVLLFHLRILQGVISRVFEHQESFQGKKHSLENSTVCTGCIQASCMELTLLVQFIFQCGNSRHTAKASRWPDLYWPISVNTAG
ncbi:hypothetical protein O181_019035 [Austropuccinia psidii MF-1]|uniref:Uncharacterized protein n=1 Tax=Austropuccinia psidii MF-1 TaxID=1389203 RepID=A0A9Q3GUM2_9BASI|nr:hypothetical protein [Austropuccinia psidii MF-1]